MKAFCGQGSSESSCTTEKTVDIDILLPLTLTLRNFGGCLYKRTGKQTA